MIFTNRFFWALIAVCFLKLILTKLIRTFFEKLKKKYPSLNYKIKILAIIFWKFY